MLRPQGVVDRCLEIIQTKPQAIAQLMRESRVGREARLRTATGDKVELDIMACRLMVVADLCLLAGWTREQAMDVTNEIIHTYYVARGAADAVQGPEVLPDAVQRPLSCVQRAPQDVGGDGDPC